MPSPARLQANRLNALRSTGPRTAAGKRRSAMNALTTGLFSRQLVLTALGETAEDLASFRRTALADLAPVGAVERELADRIALLIWRLRRPARCEAAAMSAEITRLAPDPSEVTGDGIDTCTPLPVGVAPAERLAHVRAELRSLPARIDDLRGAIAALASDDSAAIETKLVQVVLSAATSVLDWPAIPDPWPAVIIRAGCQVDRLRDISWDGATLRELLHAAAVASNRDPDGFLAAVGGRLHADADSAERRLADLCAEETALSSRLAAERERLAAQAPYANEAMILRIARAEGSLSRELERALAMLDRLRTLRADEEQSDELASFCRTER
jgi:hypothetical protein